MDSLATATLHEQPSLVFSPHPLIAERDRQNIYVPFLPGESVLSYLQRLNVRTGDRPWVLHLNDQPIPRDDWPLTFPAQGDLITLRAAVQDGGGGDENKGIRTILTIAVLAYAGQYEGALQLAIAVGGGYAVAKLFPPVLPDVDQLRGNESADSPTYSISGGSNRGRLFEPMPVLLGTHRMYPDLGAKTYTEFLGEDQYLYQVFNFGLGELTLTDYKIGDTPLSSYQDVETEVSGLDGVLTSFPGNVDTVAGAALTEAAGWVVRTSSIDATALAVELTGLLFYAGNDGITSRTVTIGLEYRAVGDVSWLPFYGIGEALLTHSTRQPLRWGYRIDVPSGQYEVRLRRVTADETDSRATSNINWSQLRTYQPDAANYSGQQRIALKIRANEQLQGQVASFNAIVSNLVQVWDGFTWTKAPSSSPAWLYLHYARGITAYDVTYLLNEDYADSTGTATAINGALSVDTARLKLTNDPAWDFSKAYWTFAVTPGETYTFTATYTPGDGFPAGKLTAAETIDGGVFDSGFFFTAGTYSLEIVATGPTLYVFAQNHAGTGSYCFWDDVSLSTIAASELVAGAGLDDSRIDIEQIKDWAVFCTTKGLTCNLVFDRKMSVEQQLSIIARCGRGAPTRAGGVLGVLWDEGNQPVQAQFGMSNIRRNSFQVSYASRRDVDEVVVEFINPAIGYQPDSVRALVPGVTNPLTTKTIPLMGCTDEAMAGAEANLEAAAYIHRRRTITWETDMEGLVVRRGDVVTLSHDLTQWDYSGRLVSGTTTELVLDSAVPFSPGYSHYVGVRSPDGSYDIYNVNYAVGETDTITLPSPLPSAPDADADGFQPWDYTWFFAPQATPGKKVKIMDFRPLGENHIQLVATDEADAYYLTESDAYTYVPVSASSDTPTIDALDITDTLINVGNGFGVRVVLALDVSGSYGGMIVRAAPSGEPLQIVVRTFDRRAEFIWGEVGNIDITVTAINARGEYGDGGTWPQFTYIVEGKSQAPNDVTNFQALLETSAIRLSWDPVPDADLLDYEVREGSTWDTAQMIDRVDTNSIKLDVAVSGTYTFLIKARDTSRNVSANATSLEVIVSLPAAPVISNSFVGENVVLSWTAAAGDFPIVEYEIRYGDTYATATFYGTIKASKIQIKAAWVGNRRWWVTGIDAAQNYGTPGAVDVTVIAPSAPVLTRKVIDNYVLLSWVPNPGTLPIAYHEIRRGDLFASATVVGESSGTFSTIFESAANTYTYWTVPVDVAGNYGAETSVVALVNAPPDFVLREDWLSDFSGTKTNAFITQEGDLLLPVNTTETWAQHFTSNSWATAQAQIDAGFPYYSMPSENSAEYEETFDYGTTLEGTLISVIANEQLITGAVTSSTTISVKKLVGDAWTDYAAVEQVYATDFRYVKIKRTYTAAGGDDLLLVKQLNVQLSLKEITDAGNGAAVSTDSGGTAVLFNKPFVAAESVVVTPRTSAAVFAVVTGYDVPNPTGFSVLLFNTSGVRVSADFGWTARGN